MKEPMTPDNVVARAIERLHDAKRMINLFIEMSVDHGFPDQPAQEELIRFIDTHLDEFEEHQGTGNRILPGMGVALSTCKGCPVNVPSPCDFAELKAKRLLGVVGK